MAGSRLEREVAVFLSAIPEEQDQLPCNVPLIALVTDTFSSEDGTCSLSLLAADVSPIGSMVTKRTLLQHVGSASAMPNPPR